jgi:hypothetical protein
MYAGIPGPQDTDILYLNEWQHSCIVKKKDLERFCQGLVQQESAMKRLQ